MILLDSSLIVAYSNQVDQNHVKALEVVRDIDGGKYGTSVITDYIFDEVVTVMLVKTKSLRQVVDLGERLLSASLMFRIDEELFRSAWGIFKEQRGPRFSFTDCTSIAACRANGISTIGTFDEEFRDIEEFNIVGE